MKVITDFSVSSAPLRANRQFVPSDLFRRGEHGVWISPRASGALFLDTEGTGEVSAFGAAVARAHDRSGNAGVAIQANPVMRPVFAVVPASGRRNRFVGTDSLASWNSVYNMQTTPTELAAPDGSGQAIRLTRLSGSGSAWRGQASVSGPSSVTFSVYAKAESISQFTPYFGGAGNSFGVHFNLLAGTVVSAGSRISAAQIQEAGEGWWRCSVSTTTLQYPATLLLLSSSGGSGESLLVWGPQLEGGLSMTPVQQVPTQYEVYEAGQPDRPYLFNDEIDDSLEIAVPDLGPSATLWWANENGITILQDQEISAGPIEILRGKRTFDFGVIGRALSDNELVRLNRHLQNSRETPS